MFGPIYIPEIRKEDFDKLLKRYSSDELMKPDDLDDKLDGIMSKPPIKKSEKDKEIDRLMEIIHAPIYQEEYQSIDRLERAKETQQTTPINEKIIIQQSFWNTVAVWIGAIGAIGVLAVAVYPSIKKQVDDYYKEKQKVKNDATHFIEFNNTHEYTKFKVESNTFYNYAYDVSLSKLTNFYFISTKEDWLFISNHIYKKGMEARLDKSIPSYNGTNGTPIMIEFK